MTLDDMKIIKAEQKNNKIIVSIELTFNPPKENCQNCEFISEYEGIKFCNSTKKGFYYRKCSIYWDTIKKNNR